MRNRYHTILALLASGSLLLCGCGKQAELTFGGQDQANGLKRINNGDGNSVITQAFGKICRVLEERPETYLYLRVDPKFKKHPTMTVTVTVEYLAAKPGSFDIQYDGGLPDDPYTASRERMTLDGFGGWETETFELGHARFQNRQNNGADLRLRVNCPEFYVHKITIARK